VLDRLLSGVVVVGRNLHLRIANQAAHQILRVDLNAYLDRPVSDLGRDSRELTQLVDALSSALAEASADWREEITVLRAEGRQVLLCRSTYLAGCEAEGGGHVLVFDDITALIQAQRDAAWGEVARRLAHEIKNPLTPIQLAAERLRHKYLSRLPPEEAAVLDRSTHTIVQQVVALKEMVNAFSDYARPPQMQSKPLELDQLVSEIMDLYAAPAGAGPRVEVRLGAPGALIEADPARLRQVIHNLVKNAQEAVGRTSGGWIGISSSQREEAGCHFVEVRLEDNGPGFREGMLSQSFEPYVTTKSKGTGLGLAIVKKIVEEHGGMITAHNRVEGGGCVVLRLPRVAAFADKGRPCVPMEPPRPRSVEL
jgi:nitrogen fixation/metabolism regulation signal transduction histidine kinase